MSSALREFSNEPGRRAVVASADAGLRRRIGASLTAMRWQVSEAKGGAEAMAWLEDQPQDALLMDGWLPDLHADELAKLLAESYPELEVLRMDGTATTAEARSPRRHELLHALREAQHEAQHENGHKPQHESGHENRHESPQQTQNGDRNGDRQPVRSAPAGTPKAPPPPVWMPPPPLPPPPPPPLPLSSSAKTAWPKPGLLDEGWGLEGMVGMSPAMYEMAHMVRLVAPRSTTVLIEGETGSGKELVAQSVHRLSARSTKPFVVLNCAAIPEALLEAELFGHARGAFTGAVQARTGRIEAAHGGTLFLDEIGEMQLGLQAKLLRFLESGELQRVGDNSTARVDVRIVAATHQDLKLRASQGAFRSDVYHRLAVFPVQVPALRERAGDIPLLIDFFLRRLAGGAPPKTLSAATREVLLAYPWPGNVRELGHVMERATILADDSPVVGPEHIRLDRLIAHRL